MKVFCLLFAVCFVAVQTQTHDEAEQTDDFPLLDGEMERANIGWIFRPWKKNERDQLKQELEARCQEKSGVCRRWFCRRNEKLVDLCGFGRTCCSRKNTTTEYF